MILQSMVENEEIWQPDDYFKFDAQASPKMSGLMPTDKCSHEHTLNQKKKER
jgi:hypothetical protein